MHIPAPSPSGQLATARSTGLNRYSPDIHLCLRSGSPSFHNVDFYVAGSPQQMAAGGRLPAPGGRRRKLFRCALRVCRPRPRYSAASTISRGSPSSTDRLPAPRFRHSRGPAQRPFQSTAVVQLEVDMSSTMGLQSRSGACCTFTRTLFCLTFETRHHSQEPACADADLR